MAFSSARSAARPLPRYQAGSGWARFWLALPTTSAPAAAASDPSSARRRSTGQRSTAGGSIATRKARSAGGVTSTVRVADRLMKRPC